MNRLGLAIACAALAAGCGDPPICESDVFLAIQTSEVSTDGDPALDGIQADVRVRTSIDEGDLVTLEVFTAAGLLLDTITATVDVAGNALFESVTLPDTAARLRASTTVFCGDGADEVTIPVASGTSCALGFGPTPLDIPFFAPARVFNAANDPSVEAGFQATLVVNTTPGSSVEIFETSNGVEQSLGAVPAGVTGILQIPRTLADGTFTYRAFCTRETATSVSPPSTVVVDTTPPTCAFASPSPGTTITPAFDANNNLVDGVQLALTAQITGTDVENEPTTLTIDQAAVASTNVVANSATAAITLAPPTTPATFAFAFTARDHAANTCAITSDFVVAFDACNLALTSPTTITDDADGIPANGSQLDVALQVSAACVGQTVTSTCGSDSPSGVVPAGGALTLRTDFCATSPCEQSSLCTFEVTSPDGVTTTTSATLSFDDVGPPTALAIVSPAVACNAQLTPAADVDPATGGVQIVARVTSPTSTARSLELANSTGTATLDATSDVAVTLAPGTNALVGIGVDALGNDTRTATCNVTLADLTLSFAQPAADGQIARADGAVTGNTITLPLCGTVNKLGASVTVSIDNNPPIAATVTGTTWCANVSLTETPHTIVAAATAGASFGSATLVVAVDITLPPPVGNLVAAVANRHLISLDWQAPSDNGNRVAGYIAKVSTSPLTETNFDSTGVTIATAAPQLPGSPEGFEFDTARVGTSYFVGLATLDAAGNRSVASIAGPLVPAFDRSGAIASPNANLGTLRFGATITHGRFNDDDFEDVAVAAPNQSSTLANAGAVYIYFGSANGISTTPDAIITSTVGNGRFGSGLAAIRWSSSNRDDLVVGAPGLSTHGRISLFRGGSTFTAGPRDAITADITISVNTAAPGFFATSSLGSYLVAADVDGDGTQDLVASAPTGGANAGGIVIVYGNVTGNVELSDIDATGMNGAIAELFRDPGANPNRRLGTYLHNVGALGGPLDITDDLVVGYLDDTTNTDSVFVLRSDGTRPQAPGVFSRAFIPGRDVRLDYITPSTSTEFGAQATSIDDQDGDGARELVVSAHRSTGERGQVLVVTGDFLGTAGVAQTTDPNTVLTTISGTSNTTRMGAILLVNDGVSDFDNDGRDDLLIVARDNASVVGFVWFGGTLPVGNTTGASAPFRLDVPSSFRIGFLNRPGSLGNAQWVGDLDGDGIVDVCWASPIDNLDDGSFEVFD